MKNPRNQYDIFIYLDKAGKDRIRAFVLHSHAGGYSQAVKKLVREGIDRYLSTLSPRDRKIFDEILANVSLGSNYTDKGKRPIRYNYIKKKDRHPGGI